MFLGVFGVLREGSGTILRRRIHKPGVFSWILCFGGAFWWRPANPSSSSDHPGANLAEFSGSEGVQMSINHSDYCVLSTLRKTQQKCMRSAKKVKSRQTPPPPRDIQGERPLDHKFYRKVSLISTLIEGSTANLQQHCLIRQSFKLLAPNLMISSFY